MIDEIIAIIHKLIEGNPAFSKVSIEKIEEVPLYYVSFIYKNEFYRVDISNSKICFAYYRNYFYIDMPESVKYKVYDLCEALISHVDAVSRGIITDMANCEDINIDG